MSLPHKPTKSQIIERMTRGTDDVISEHAELVHTDNGYWLAWHDGVAAVLHEDAAEDEACFWVEGAASMSDLIDMLTNGDFDEIEEFDGDEAAWNDTVLDSEAHHDHQHGDDCGCHDHTHQHTQHNHE